MAISLQCFRHLMELTPTYLSSRRISKIISKSPKIISTNNNSNWINILEVKKPLLSSKTSMFQQLFHLIDFLKKAKTLGKLIANLTLTTNLVSSIARIQIPDIFDGTDLEILNSFYNQTHKKGLVSLNLF